VWSRLVRWAFVIFLACLTVFGILLAAWRVLPPTSTLMLAYYLTGRPVEREWTPLDRISMNLRAAVIASEDGQFCRHHGVDWGALSEVIEAAGDDGPSRGASTIAMQTAKNLFLWPSRSYVRKGMEIPLALLIDFLWGKRRVLEIYLNIAEWGSGAFGAQVAAHRYFKKDAAHLTVREAALLAAALPDPQRRNPARPGARQTRLAGVVIRRAARAGPWLDCVR
jgi:monofunctional biosynthetic peptidoglycan transglycosylase